LDNDTAAEVHIPICSAFIEGFTSADKNIFSIPKALVVQAPETLRSRRTFILHPNVSISPFPVFPRMSAVTPTPQEVEKYVLAASDATNPEYQRQANSLLHQWVSSSSDNLIADTILDVLRFSQKEVVLFYALSIYLRLDKATPQQRMFFRQEILMQLSLGTETAASEYYHHSSWGPTYLRTKVGALMAHFIELDFPHAWPAAFEELADPRLLQTSPVPNTLYLLG
jgi:hypothetical protein